MERLFRDFREEDLPHYHLLRGETWSAIDKILAVGPRLPLGSIINGAWCRPLFMGGYMESTEADTEVRNIQTNTLFVDLRFPRGPVAEKMRETARAAGSLTALS